jgi:ribosomal protein L5
MLVGCKVTLRKNNLFDFLDNLNLALPRMEKFTPIKIQKTEKIKTNSLILPLTEVVLFYPIELGLGINTEVKKIELNIIFNTFSREEKIYYLRANKIPVN